MYKRQGGIRPIPTAIYRRQAAGKTTLLYALCPAATAAPCPVKGLRLDAAALTLSFADGSEKSVKFQAMPAVK